MAGVEMCRSGNRSCRNVGTPGCRSLMTGHRTMMMRDGGASAAWRSGDPRYPEVRGLLPELDFIEKCGASPAGVTLKDGLRTEHLIGTLEGEPETSEVTEGAP